MEHYLLSHLFHVKKNNIKFIDLFAGIGGFHLGLHKAGASCVFACEIDKYARKTYQENIKQINPDLFKKDNLFIKDIREIIPKEIPDFDILCAGFPCQPFSQAGKKEGFSDKSNRGNLFFEIMRIVEEKKPKVLFLENVRHLVNHDNGKTFKVIKSEIEKAGYSFHWKIIKASEFGLPQHRPRIYIIAIRNDLNLNFEFPNPYELTLTMNDIFKGNCNKKIGYTLRVGGRSSGINDRRNWDSYLVNDKIVKINSDFGKKMMGFPDNFSFSVSETQSMKQLGNSVAINPVYEIGKKIVKLLEKD